MDLDPRNNCHCGNGLRHGKSCSRAQCTGYGRRWTGADHDRYRVVDARRFIIPDDLNIAALGLAFVNTTFGGNEPAVAAITAAVVRGCTLSLAFLGLRIIYRHLRKRDGLGLGDVKLAGVAGAWLGWQTMSIAVEIAAVSALIVYLGRQLASGRPLRSTSYLPFGLFLAPAIWLGWLIETMWLAPQ
jgi:leader peptidase (prepilin peptidase)/N-methyltransferase